MGNTAECKAKRATANICPICGYAPSDFLTLNHIETHMSFTEYTEKYPEHASQTFYHLQQTTACQLKFLDPKKAKPRKVAIKKKGVNCYALSQPCYAFDKLTGKHLWFATRYTCLNFTGISPTNFYRNNRGETDQYFAKVISTEEYSSKRLNDD
jgi:hypothetical protein